MSGPRCRDEAMPKPSLVKAVSVGRNTVTASCQTVRARAFWYPQKNRQWGNSAYTTESLEGPYDRYDWDEARKEAIRLFMKNVMCRKKIKAPSLLHKASEIVYMFTHKIGDVGRIFLPFKFLPLLTATAQIHYAHLRSPCPGHSIWHQLQCLKGMT